MKRATYFLIMFIFISNVLSADNPFESFNDLKEMVVDQTPVGPIKIFYNPAFTTIINEKREHDYIEITTVLKTKIIYNKSEEYIIEYDQGMSVDPGFTIYKNDGKMTEVGGISCTEIVIPGNGNIYASGHTNNMFNTRRKYSLVDGKLVHIKQQYYYVGLETYTNSDITLYSSRDFKTVIAQLPKGTHIFVILNEGNFYLIKTPLGLLGWYNMLRKASIHNRKESPLNGIFYNGD